MADGVFNIAKGRVNELVSRVALNDPANSALVVVLLQAAGTDAALEDFDTLDDILSDAAFTEATFTNYARQALTDSELSAPSPDDTNNRMDADIPDLTYANAGGTADNTLVKLLICYDADTTGGDDSAIVPLTHHDFSATTDGNTLQATINSAGFYRAS